MATIPEFNSTPWSLPVGCHSIIVKHAAILRSFPAGVRAFERSFRPIRKSWVLYLVIALTREGAARVLARLEENGLHPGVDFAAADALRRPILECLGVAFINHGGHHRTVDLAIERRAGDVGLVVPAQFTSVTSLTRKADRSRFVEDLKLAVLSEGLAALPIVRERDDYTSIDINRADLSALITFAHTRRDPVPLVHWHGANANLRMVASAWSSVNPFHRRKATSFPDDLNEVIGCLLRGLRAARDGSAFLPGVEA